MTIARGLSELGLDQAMMCGSLPPTEEEYQPVGHCRNLLWEMSFEEGFSFSGSLEPIVKLHSDHPSVRGVLLDDFSSVEIAKGATPGVLRQMRAAMPDSLDLWIVVYSMNLSIPNLAEYLEHVDGISFWFWKAGELGGMREKVDECRKLSGRKPLVMGLYFYDFGTQREMSLADMEAQMGTAVDLLREEKVSGLCFLSSSIMDVGLGTVEWTKGWIEEHGMEAYQGSSPTHLVTNPPRHEE
jgi:hypothetical protein